MPTSDKRKKSRNKTPKAPTVVVTSNDDRYAVTTWGQNGGAVDLTVPSGQLCLAIKPGLEGLLKSGVLHGIDPLVALVEEHQSRMQGRESDQAFGLEVMNDPEKLDQILHMVDKVMCHVVLKPKISLTPDDPTRRVPGNLYADNVDLEDKIYIMSWALGMAGDLDNFRSQLSEDVGDVDSIQSDGSPSQ